jgi:transposase
MINTARPRDVVGETRRGPASELIHELVTLDEKIKIANQELTELVTSTGSRLQQLHGIGPSGTARPLGDIGDINRLAGRAYFASWNGTAPIDASSGDHNRHRLSRAGNRRINRVLHIMAHVQLRHDTEGRRYYRRKLVAGKPRCRPYGPSMPPVRRRLPATGLRCQTPRDGPGGHVGATLKSSAADPIPHGRHLGHVTSRTR